MYKILKSRNVYIDNNVLVIEIPNIEMKNLQNFGLIICQNIPKECNEKYKVIIKNGNNFIYLKTFSGNFARADQLKTRTYYPIVYGIDPIHISIIRPIINTKFQYNCKLED